MERQSTAVMMGSARLLPNSRRGRLALLALGLCLLADLAAGAAPDANAQPDLAEYHAYALAFLAHHSLPSEYPPLSIAAFLLSVVPPVSSFALVFGTWMLILVAAAYVLLATAFGPARGLAFLAYTIAGAAATVLSRFDMIPAALVLLAYLALQRKGWLACYVLLALGTLFKLYPFFLVPLVVIDQVRSSTVGGARVAITRALSGAAAFAGVVGAGFGLAGLLDRPGAFEVFSYAASRPLEVESGPATMLWLLSLLGDHVQGFYSYRSYNLLGDADRYLAPAAAAAMLLALGYVYARRWARRIDAGRAWTATLLAVVLTSKALSAQYLIWIFPLVAATEGLTAVWMLIALLTTLIFPFLLGLNVRFMGFGRLGFDPPLMFVIAVRNGALLLVTLQAFGWMRSRAAEVSR